MCCYAPLIKLSVRLVPTAVPPCPRSAIERGQWVLLDSANLCNPTVLDRLNPLLEPQGESNACTGLRTTCRASSWLWAASLHAHVHQDSTLKASAPSASRRAAAK